MKKVLFVILILPLLLTSKAFSSMSSYCDTPPFVSRTIAPNVMIILDNSGSMFNFAYNYNGSDVSTGFDPNTSYYGYFDSNYWYKYESEKFVPTALKSSRSKYSDEWDGNFLNWLTMRRIDIARKVLTGGKYSGGCLIGEEADLYSRGYVKKIDNAENYTPYSGTEYFDFDVGGSGASRFEVCSNCSCSWSSDDEVYLCSCSGCSGYFNVKPQVDSEPQGIVQKIGDKVRWGLAFYHVNWNDNGGYIQVPIRNNNNTQSMVNDINNKNPDSNTPLAETLWTVAGYFAQKASMLGGPGPRYQNGDYQINNHVDPYNYGTGGSPQWAWCAKSFVIYITDGEPCGDDYLPDSLKNYAANHGGYSYAGDLPSCDAHGNNPWIEDVALYVHTVDLRPDLEGKQTLTIYPIFAFGSGSELLKDAAINGGFIDQNGNDKPDLQSEWDKNGDGIPDNYFEAQNGYELESALSQAISDILKRASSGTAVSTLSTSTQGSGCMAQAYFLPSESSSANGKLSWMGELKGLWLDPLGQIRVDSDSSNNASGTNVKAQLELDKDKVLKFYNTGTETVGHLYASDKYGTVEFPCGPYEEVNLQNLAAIWDVGKKLWEENPNNRTIYTGSYNNGFSLIDFKDTNASSLKSLLRACDTSDAQHIIDYVRGEDTDICIDSDNGSCSYDSCSKDHRSRLLTINGTQHVWKLGDVVYSTPRILSHFALNTYDIKYGDKSYTDFIKEHAYDPTASNPVKRNDYLFVGANDGMLHCFYIGRIKEVSPDTDHPGLKAILEDPENKILGTEVWAYIPINVLPYLKYLAYPDYCHIYFVDQRPLLFDASIHGAAGDTKTKDSWRTILIGELRFGGSPNPPSDAPTLNGKKVGLSSIFALDITDPESPSLLWEFTDSDLGFTTSYPAIVRIGDKDKNGTWYVVLGSGPTDYDGNNPPSKGYLYVLDLRTGSLVKKIEIGNNTYVGDCLAVDPDNDYNVDAIYCGTVEKSGNSLSGKMLRILVKGQSDPSNWQVTTLADAGAPITAAPKVAFDEAGHLWVFWGTGKFFGTSDKTDNSQQYLYGIKDTCWSYSDTNNKWQYGETCSKVTNIIDTTNITVSGDIADYICKCEGGQVNCCQYDTNGKCTQPAKGTDANGNPICNCGKMVVTGVKNVTVNNCNGHTRWEDCVNYITTNYDGWKRRLTVPQSGASERDISEPEVIGQIAMFTTFKPNEDICGYGGDSYLYSLYYKAGITYKRPSILLDVGFQNGQIQAGVYIGKGAPAIGESISTKQVRNTLKTYVQLSTGQVKEIDQKPVFLPNEIQFWIEK